MTLHRCISSKEPTYTKCFIPTPKLTSEVGERVEEGHVGAAHGRIAHLGKEGHDGHEHRVQRHLYIGLEKQQDFIW